MKLAKFGNPSMPFGDEAKEFTRKLVDHKVVRIKLLRKDQYNRVVAKVTIKGFLPFTKKDVTLQLAERGLATLYTGGGAEYDVRRILLVRGHFTFLTHQSMDLILQGKRELIEKKIDEAKRRKKGVWKNGSKFETPAEFKRKAKQVAKVAGIAAKTY